MPEDVFDEPSRWRHEAILALGLDGEERIAGAVTGVAYPDALAPILAARPDGLTTIGDLGAGLGGAAEWFRSRSGAAVLAVEPEAPATLAARQLFPQVRIARATAAALPWADRTCGVVTLLGVISLLRDPGPALREAVRVAGAAAVVGIADLFAAGDGPLVHGANVFPAVAGVAQTLSRLGFEVVDTWSAPADVSTRWDEIGHRVDDEIERRHGADHGYAAWAEDRRQLAELIDQRTVSATTIVTRRRSP